MSPPYLFLDCETTGVHAGARLVALAAQWDVPQEAGNTRSFLINHLVKPEGFEIPLKATEIHRINHHVASEYGWPLDRVLSDLASLLIATKRDSGTVVAHNLDFELRVLTYEFDKAQMGPLPIHRSFCTMKELSPRYVPWGNRSLQNCHMAMIGVPPSGPAHSARHDMLACRAIFYEGIKKGYWTS